MDDYTPNQQTPYQRLSLAALTYIFSFCTIVAADLTALYIVAWWTGALMAIQQMKAATALMGAL